MGNQFAAWVSNRFADTMDMLTEDILPATFLIGLTIILAIMNWICQI